MRQTLAKGDIMKKQASDAGQILNALGKLTAYLNAMDHDLSQKRYSDKDICFDYPLEIISETLLFNISVLYRVSNVINDRLILEVVKVMDPASMRMDLQEGRKIRVFTDARDKRYVNEVHAFMNKKTSQINVKGMGCDIMGYVNFSEDFGGTYLVGGDFLGKESGIKDYEISAMEIMCNLLSTIIMKTRFERKAEYDDLTGLYNSGKIKEELERILLRLKRKPHRSAVLAMGDIDFFKSVNDDYGHIQGDLVLKEVGNIISHSMRQGFDLAGRYGGEEFLMIFDDTDAEEGMEAVERIRKTIRGHNFPVVNREGNLIPRKKLNITISFGMVQISGEDITGSITDWIARADDALYQSKNNGRNQTTLLKED